MNTVHDDKIDFKKKDLLKKSERRFYELIFFRVQRISNSGSPGWTSLKQYRLTQYKLAMKNSPIEVSRFAVKKKDYFNCI